jgi:hypothetical protein
MTERKRPDGRRESLIERQIRGARAEGRFDALPLDVEALLRAWLARPR